MEADVNASETASALTCDSDKSGANAVDSASTRALAGSILNYRQVCVVDKPDSKACVKRNLFIYFRSTQRMAVKTAFRNACASIMSVTLLTIARTWVVLMHGLTRLMIRLVVQRTWCPIS